MKNDAFLRLWDEFCDPEKTCMERLRIAHLLERELSR